MSQASSDPLVSSPPLAGERVAFTGVLASMTHKQAHELVTQHGGEATEHVSRQTTMLVVGEEGWPLESDGQTSVKFQQAQRGLEAGQTIRIVSESDWLRFLGLKPATPDVRGQYTPAMLSQMLGVPVTTIRQWERTGLIRPVQRIYRLPYFDFQEVASARRLTDLLAAGVSRRQIENSLRELSGVLGDVARPLAQLEFLSSVRELGYRDDAGRLKTLAGQRLFEFDRLDEPADAEPSIRLPEPDEPSTPASCFAEACRLVNVGDLTAAIALYRRVLRERPVDPETRFHLAETLYRAGNTAGAVEQYRMAAELELDYVEAWTQLGCVALETQDTATAEEAFRAALKRHPDYPDAHYHLAQLLTESGRMAEASAHWKRYLEFDDTGPWAATARQRLSEFQEDDSPRQQT